MNGNVLELMTSLSDGSLPPESDRTNGAAGASGGTQLVPATPAECNASSEGDKTSSVLTPQKLRPLGVLWPAEVDRICAEERWTEFLVEGFLPAKSIAIAGGDSTIGKSPLLCQLGLCVAAGIPFLGMKTSQSRVLYLDLENSLLDCKAMRDALVRFLGLNDTPADFLLLAEPPNDLERVIAEVKPTLIVIDSLRAFRPEVTEKNPVAGEGLKGIRRLSRKYGCAFLLVHHLRKPGENSFGLSLEEETRVANWLLEMEGPRALVNQTDLRIAVAEGDGKPAALKLKWSRRVHGDSPLVLLERVYDDGEPVGYRPLTGRDFLTPEQQRALDALPDNVEWGFKDAKQALGTPTQPAPDNRTNEFLNKSRQHRLVEKLGKNRYRKQGQAGGVAGVTNEALSSQSVGTVGG